MGESSYICRQNLNNIHKITKDPMTALVSVIPILLLIVLMMGFKVSGYKSAIITLIVTILLALFAVPAMGIVPEKYAGVSIFGITWWSVVEGLGMHGCGRREYSYHQFHNQRLFGNLTGNQCRYRKCCRKQR